MLSVLTTCDCMLSHVRFFVALQAPLSMGFPRQEYWSGLPFPSPKDLLHPEIEPSSPALAGRFFFTEPGTEDKQQWLPQDFLLSYMKL